MVNPLLPLKVRGLRLRRGGRSVLGPLDMDLDQPGITTIIGPNGAGKTSLLRALHGLERRIDGEITFALPSSEAAGRQTFVFQTPILLRRSVAGNLAYPLQIAGTPPARIDALVAQWAERIGLSAALNRPATRLSGGEKQKLALARALIAEPDFLFLDEPCTNLDGKATREIEALLTAEAQRGTAILLATHDIGQVRRLAQHLIFLHQGRILEEGPAQELITAPQTGALAAYLAGDIVP